MASSPNTTTAGNTSPPKSPSIHVREPSTTKASIPPQSMHTLSPLNFATPSGARSPSASGSMPSSPTSIHSSSSAIFERDIEQPLTATTNSLHILHKDPHHTARAVAHEPLESSVPSVLSAAVTALGEVDSASLTAPHTGGGGSSTGGKEIRKGMSMDDISVIAPSPLSPQNWTASTAGSIRLGASRSPSPHLLPLPGLPLAAGQQQQAQSPSAANRITRPGVPKRINTGGSADGDNGLATATAVPPTGAAAPSVIGVVPPTPNANTFGFASPAGTKPSNSGSTSPQSATASPLIVTPPLPVGAATGIPIARSGGASRSTSRPTSIAMSLEELSLAPLVATTADSPVPVPPDVEPIAFSGSVHPRPPSPNASTSNNNASKRLSFISYNDLLNSTPMSSFPLSSVTSGSAEPPHQVDVTLRSPRRTRTNSRQSTLNRSPVSDVFGARTSVFEDENLGGVLSTAAAASATGAVANSQGSLQHMHDVGPKGGGEWEREGMGSGLEERLEAALKEQQARERDVAPSNSSAVGA